MQKLRFINGNGVELDLTSGVYGITKWKGLSNTNLNLQTQKVPNYDGSVYIDGLLENRNIELTLCINDNNDLSVRYEKRRELCEVLNPKLGEGYLIYENNSYKRRIKAIPELPVIENKNSNESGSVKASLSFICPDVYWEDVEETSVNINMGQRISVENKGDVALQPKISFNCNSALNPVLRNLNNGKKISINGTLSNSILNLEKGKKTFLKTKYGFTNNNNYNNFEENDDFQLLFSTNCISKTDDFENFETIYIMPNETVLCSGYGRGLFFYGGEYLKKSTDGETWETITAKPSGNVTAIYYDKTDDVFYFGIEGHLYSSSDLTIFTDLGTNTDSAAINAITRHGSLIVCVGNSGTCNTYDGANFTAITTSTTYNLFTVASDGTNLVIGGGASNVGGVFKYSTDNGSTWNNVSVTQKISSICYSNTYGIFFACGDIIVGKGLPNNMVWEELGTEARSVCKESKLFGQIEILGVDMVVYSGEFKKICNYPYDAICGVYFKGKYIAAGAEGHIYISDNYIWWEESPASGRISNSIYFAEIANDTAYFFTKQGDIIYTIDGDNFNFIPKVDYDHIIYFNNDYYAIHGNNVYKINVYNILDTSLVLESTLGINNVHVANNRLICLCDNGFEVTADGTTWTSYSKGTITEDLYDIVFYNNKYYVRTETKVYETSDFTTFTEVLTSYVSETSKINNIAVLNNDFFFVVQSFNAEQGYYESTLYKGLSTPVTMDSIIGSYFNFYFSNGNYVINRQYYNSSTETIIMGAKVTDFSGYTQEYNNFILVDNNIFYDVDMSENTLSKNGVLIMKLDAPLITMTEASNNVTINNNSLCFLSTGSAITSFVSSITSVYVDNIMYLTANGLCTIDTNNKIEKHSSSSLYALTGNDNYIFTFGFHTITKYAKTDLSTAVETYTISNLTSIYNGACLYYNNRLIWATEGYIEIYNLSTGIKTEISTNVLVADIKVIDNIVFGIGNGGYIYTSDMKNITEVYRASFVFTSFVRNYLKRFIALYGALGELIILDDENIISMITDISFELQEGENEIVLNCDSGYINVIMTYRQRYVGL